MAAVPSGEVTASGLIKVIFAQTSMRKHVQLVDFKPASNTKALRMPIMNHKSFSALSCLRLYSKYSSHMVFYSGVTDIDAGGNSYNKKKGFKSLPGNICIYKIRNLKETWKLFEKRCLQLSNLIMCIYKTHTLHNC